eukprot:symbB.v1.2.005778.t1/scaffold289.1/size287290/23
MKPLHRASRKWLSSFGAGVRHVATSHSSQVNPAAFVFSPENFRRPDLPKGLNVLDIDPQVASDSTLAGLGRLVHNPEDFTVAEKTFEITPWPQPGWRPLDPGTGRFLLWQEFGHSDEKQRVFGWTWCCA